MDKAQELADLLATCEELNAMRDAEVAMYSDAAAQEIINEFQQAQQEFHEVYSRGEDLTDAQRAKANEIEVKMDSNPAISKYVAAQEKFESVLQGVNMIISRAISGEQNEEDGCSSCGGGCSSGCC